MDDVEETLTKTCNKCGVVKELGGFSKKKSSKDGLQPSCKRCNAEYRRANRDRIAEYLAEYRQANRDRIAEYRQANRDRIAEYWAEYRRANPHIFREAYHRRRARKLKNGVEYFREIDMYERDNWTCQLCFKPIDPNLEYRNEDGTVNLESKSVDHIIPVAKGGAHRLDNVQAAHLGCNLSKGDRIEDDNGFSRAD